ncbi:MAG: ketopantoate reductase family protein [Christensenellales bacterium]
MKYAIYGAGSLGIVLSAYLSNAGEKFDIIDRNAKSVEAINKNGVKVVGTTQMQAKANAVLDSEVKDKYDIIFLMTKQLNKKETIKKASEFLTENGVICTCQNGLPEKDVAEIIGENRTYGCAIGWGATRLDYGVSELTSTPQKETLSFNFGSFSGQKGEIFEEIIRIFSIMGNVTVEENFIGARWAKVLINSAFSGMSTVVGATFGEASKDKESRRIIQQIIKECIEVAKASNIKIEKVQGKDIVKLLDYKGKFKKWLSFQIIPLAIKKHSLLKASMLQDIEKGIKCEIDSINGTVCEYGKRCNIPTPFNEKVVEIVHKLESKELTPCKENVNLFKDLF